MRTKGQEMYCYLYCLWHFLCGEKEKRIEKRGDRGTITVCICIWYNTIFVYLYIYTQQGTKFETHFASAPPLEEGERDKVMLLTLSMGKSGV